MKVENLESKFINYSLLSGAFLLIYQRIDSQVVYTDVNPDTIFDAAGEGAYFDIDENGTFDIAVLNSSFIFTTLTYSDSILRQDILAGPLTPQNALAGISNHYSTSMGGFIRYFPYALESNFVIGDFLQWQTAGLQIMAIKDYFESGYTGPCFNCYWYGFTVIMTIDHFLGFRFVGVDGENHYGWMRCDVKDEGRTLIVKDYAYEMQPNYPIVAGDSVSYVEINNYENTLDAVVYTFDKKLYVQTSLYTNTFLSIYDATGRIIFFESHLGSNSEIIDIAQFPDGIYIVTLRQNEKVYSRKISF